MVLLMSSFGRDRMVTELTLLLAFSNVQNVIVVERSMVPALEIR